MVRRSGARILGTALLFFATALAGCVANEPTPDLVSDRLSGISPPAAGTVVHRGNVSLDETTIALETDLIAELSSAVGLARYTGFRTFEPTIGAYKDAVFMSSFGNNQQAKIARSRDGGLTWKEISQTVPGNGAITMPPNSNDPYIYVDTVTGRLFSSDLEALICSWLGWSDDLGATWETNPVGCGHPFGGQDHQTLTTAKPRTVTTNGYANVLYYCINQVYRASCATSLDGGTTFGPLVTVYDGEVVSPEADEDVPFGRFCGGLHGHVKASPDGIVYLPKGHCGKAMVGVSKDDGQTWATYTISNDVNASDHEVRIAVDDAGAVYAFWEGDDGLPYLAHSTDEGTTWSDPRMVAPPAVTGMSHLAIAAGAPGRVTLAYAGTEYPDPYNYTEDKERPQFWQQNMTWNGYIAVILDALADDPAIVTVTAHDPLDPIARGVCGHTRCAGGLGDFIDVVIDDEGRPWAAFADVCDEKCAGPDAKTNSGGVKGFAGTLQTGPKLRGELGLLVELEVDAPVETTG